MSEHFGIRLLQPFTKAEIWPIITGYETQEIYAVEKTETDSHTTFDIHLTRLDQPYRSSFFSDFTDEDIHWYLSLLPQGYSFGAYQAGRLIGFAIVEHDGPKRLLFIREFHVMDGFRRMGVGRALMGQVIAKARGDHMAMIMLETQNTNVKAIRFYRSMGFSIHSIDISQYFYLGDDAREVAFYMKLPLEGGLPANTRI